MKKLVCLTALLIWSMPTQAQNYPTKPIRVIAGMQAGSSGDVAGRMIANKMSATIGQPLVFESKPGANGTIAATYGRALPADGYAITYISSGTAVTGKYLMKEFSLDILKDFEPITLALSAPSFLVVNKSVRANSTQELIDDARQYPGKLNYGSTGIGSAFHLIGESLKMATGVDIVHVPYSGTSAATVVNDLVQDRIQIYVPSRTTIASQRNTGNLKLLAVFDTRRFKRLPDVPTVNETLPHNRLIPSWFAFFGPAGLPKSIAVKLQGEIKEALRDPDIMAKLDELGSVPVASTPDELAKAIRDGESDVAALVKALNIQPN